jgi:hypothetical protein
MTISEWRDALGKAKRQGIKMTEPKTGLANLELKDAVRLRWTLHDIKGHRTEIFPVSPDDLGTLIDMGLVEMRDNVPVVTSAGDAEIS